MADFESQLSELFEAQADKALGERLTHAAMAQIEREDRRRQLVLTAGAAAGVMVSAATIAGSGALGDLGGLGVRMMTELPQLMGKPLVLLGAAAAFAAYAVATLRPGRAL